MRLPAIAIAIVLFAVTLMPVSAQTVFSVGVYEFEDTIASMTYSGTWTTTNALGAGPTYRQTIAAGANVSFLVSGHTLVIWRYLTANQPTYTMNFCVNASCTTINNYWSGDSGWYFFAVTLPAGTNTITMTRNAGGVYLDRFMILADPVAGSYPTAVPTATILPSSTPASTTTPQPTPTPQPTSTPQPSSTPLSVIWAIDPEKSYGSVNGQITAVDYSASAADIHIANLLTLLVISVWGFFFFCVFVLVKYKVGKK